MEPKEALATLIYGLTNNQYAKEDLGVTMSKCEEIIQNALTRLEKLNEFVKHYNDYKERICDLQFANRSLVEENENYANEIYNVYDRNERLCSRLDKQRAKIYKLEKAIRDLFANHIEFVSEKDKCYFKIKNSKGKEKSFTSKTFEDFWKEVFTQ